ncbi:hypothetical protein EYF80_057481 [Liparis tanakae]|uniref:Uncharacterized protein n=1 Tax=Liparis tanakae TaxID=230148 RepID=A0A4Z2EUY8_9TELE|nr:hypothetical protein EYF80_057481 [Liparis tanakae]
MRGPAPTAPSGDSERRGGLFVSEEHEPTTSGEDELLTHLFILTLLLIFIFCEPSEERRTRAAANEASRTLVFERLTRP